MHPMRTNMPCASDSLWISKKQWGVIPYFMSQPKHQGSSLRLQRSSKIGPRTPDADPKTFSIS